MYSTTPSDQRWNWGTCLETGRASRGPRLSLLTELEVASCGAIAQADAFTHLSHKVGGWVLMGQIVSQTCLTPLHLPRLFLVLLFPTCQVRVVRFYVSCFLLVLLVLLLLLPLLVLLPPPPLFPLLSSPLLSSSPLLLLPAGLQPRPSTPSVPCRTSTTTIHAQCSLPDLNREYPGPVFPAGPEPRPSTPSVPCRTSTARIHAKCSLPDLM